MFHILFFIGMVETGCVCFFMMLRIAKSASLDSPYSVPSRKYFKMPVLGFAFLVTSSLILAINEILVMVYRTPYGNPIFWYGWILFAVGIVILLIWSLLDKLPKYTRKS